MAYFAQIVGDSVMNVIMVGDTELSTPYPASEAEGQAFIASIGLDGYWKQVTIHEAGADGIPSAAWSFDAKTDSFIRPEA